MQNHLNKDIQNQLSCFGYSVRDDFFSPGELDPLLCDFKSCQEQDRFRAAKVSDGERHQKIRGDYIHWWDESRLSLSQNTIQTKLKQFLLGLNKRFFFNIDHINLHYAFYPKGSFYKTHLDQPIGKDERVVTFILYLNPHWKPGDGGELKLYLDESLQEYEIIEPVYGRTVFFLSHQFYHEVLLAHKERLSLTGWFRRKSAGVLPGVK